MGYTGYISSYWTQQWVSYMSQFPLFRCISISSTYPALDPHGGFLDHGMLYIFWKVRQRPLHLSEKIQVPTYMYVLTHLPTYLPINPRDLWPLRPLIWVTRRHDLTKKHCLPTYLPTYLPTSLGEHPSGAILQTCDLNIWSAWRPDLTNQPT